MADSNFTGLPPDENTQADKPIAANDPATDQAVEDIVRNEADDELKAQDAASGATVVMKLSLWERFKNFQSDWWGSPGKKWGTIFLFLLIIIALFALPVTRYEIVGLVMQEKITVRVVDSKSGEPVSAAIVRAGNKEVAETNGNGLAVLYVNAGMRKLVVTKQYYTGSTQSIVVSLSASRNLFKAKLVALGRQVKIKLQNTISGKPLVNADIRSGNVSAKTNSSGIAMIVLPSSAVSQSATITTNGYNTKTVTIAAAGTTAQNTFRVTPSGKLYFLSYVTGTINVVQTNLDGTDKQTVLAGTGEEKPNTTELMVSPDWKYVALLAQRSGSSASLYVINTTNGNGLTTVDNTSGTFNLIGWSGDSFIYQVTRSSVSDWQTGQQQLKSYSPSNGQMSLLDQTQASGTSQADYLMQNFGQAYIMDGQVVYSKGWQASGQSLDLLTSKSAELDSIDADGSSHKVIQTFSLSSDLPSKTESLALVTRETAPGNLYIDFQGNPTDTFYTYANGQVSTNATLTDSSFTKPTYPTYITSPSGDSTFWSEQQGSTNTLFTGNASGANEKQIATQSIYAPYGWYTDSYLLVSQNNNELYIMPASGGIPLQVSTYFNPTPNDGGYSGGQ